MKKIKYAVLDLGNVLINNDPLLAYIYALLHNTILKKHRVLTFIDLLDQRAEFFNNGITESIFYHIAERYLTKSEIRSFKLEYKKRVQSDLDYFYPFITGSRLFCSKLRERHSLGVLANQPAVINQHLINNGYDKYFDFIGLSEELSLQKPDIEIFEWMLARTGADPEEICYIGDSIANDIIPACSLGINVVLLRLDINKKGFCPRHEYEKQFLKHQTLLEHKVLSQAKSFSPSLDIAFNYEQVLDL